jgi:uroporphyrinogen decarboxylase
MTGLERLDRAVRFQPTDRVPVAPLLGAHAVALAGITYEAASADPTAQAHALLRAVERYRPDAIFTLMDLSAEPEALGAAVTASATSSRIVTRHLAPEALLADDLESVILTARVPAFVDTVHRLRAALCDTVMVGALISGPLTAAANAVGIETIARMLRRQRETLADMLERLTKACMAVASAHLEAGAHGVMLLEPCATSGILGPDDLSSLLLARLQALAEHIRDRHGIGLLHICGDCRASLPALAESRFDVLSLDAPVDLPQAREVIARSAALMGNLDVRQLLPRGEPESVCDAAAALVADLGRAGGFILSGGCELPADAPTCNVLRMVEASALSSPRVYSADTHRQARTTSCTG